MANIRDEVQTSLLGVVIVRGRFRDNNCSSYGLYTRDADVLISHLDKNDYADQMARYVHFCVCYSWVHT